ncbi:PIN domain-containing protein [Rhodoferax sp.]|uniref:type II toxin-antitoxin system VapC family toxin n=1 Tax=Rhodoferax sp. TaxID=50421 RepID=UPI00262F00AB|nr:PIN domain-containing protein [Rhodoferax sp.]MDD5481098.1 PIN domain-containing protein [Rhodoferax sp.]
MIADTSAWIEFLRASDSPADRRLRRAFREDEKVWMPDVVYREVLQGASKPSIFHELQELLDTMPAFVSADPWALSRNAALLYARCRWQGFTVRSPNDCLIAVYAIEASEPLLAQDRDFAAIAHIEPKLQLIF